MNELEKCFKENEEKRIEEIMKPIKEWKENLTNLQHHELMSGIQFDASPLSRENLGSNESDEKFIQQAKVKYVKISEFKADDAFYQGAAQEETGNNLMSRIYVDSIPLMNTDIDYKFLHDISKYEYKPKPSLMLTTEEIMQRTDVMIRFIYKLSYMDNNAAITTNEFITGYDQATHEIAEGARDILKELEKLDEKYFKQAKS